MPVMATGAGSNDSPAYSEQTAAGAAVQHLRERQSPSQHAARAVGVAAPCPLVTTGMGLHGQLQCQEQLDADACSDALRCTGEAAPSCSLQAHERLLTPPASAGGPGTPASCTHTSSLLCNSTLTMEAPAHAGVGPTCLGHSPTPTSSPSVHPMLLPTATTHISAATVPAPPAAAAAATPTHAGPVGATRRSPRFLAAAAQAGPASSSSSCTPPACTAAGRQEVLGSYSRSCSSSSSSSSSSSDSEDMCPPVACLSPHRQGPGAALPPAQPQRGDAAVGLLYDQSMELHQGPAYPEHYEQPQRIMQVYAELEAQGLLPRCWLLPPRPATNSELLAVHTQGHLHEVRALWTDRPEDKADARYVHKGADLYICSHTEQAARMAAGCCVQAVHSVLRGEVRAALAVVRPPGHHAECARAQGFCFYNNCAVAARAALTHPGVQRVFILDWDVHHGNGIQQVLWEDPAMLYCSIHRDPKNFYPYTSGFVGEVGAGRGRGFNINIPWAKRNMGDAEYLAAFALVVEPVLRAWQPDLLVVAAGYDAAEGDPLGGCKLSPQGYAAMTRRLLQFAGGRVVLALEGGYNTRVTAACAAACVKVLLEEQPHQQQPHQQQQPLQAVASTDHEVQQDGHARHQHQHHHHHHQRHHQHQQHQQHGTTADHQPQQPQQQQALTAEAARACAGSCALTQQLAALQLQPAGARETLASSTHYSSGAAAQAAPGEPVISTGSNSCASLGQRSTSKASPAMQQAKHSAGTAAAAAAAATASPAAGAPPAGPVPAAAAAEAAARPAAASPRSGLAAEIANRRQAMKATGAAAGGHASSSCVVTAPVQVWPAGDAIKVLRQVCEVQAPFWPVLADPPFNTRWEQYQQQLDKQRPHRKA